MIGKYKNLSASAQIKLGAGELIGLMVNSASGSPTVKLNDGVSGEGASAAPATQTLTISGGVLVPGKHAENTITSDATNVSPLVAATSTLTSTNTAPVDGATVTIDTKTYTFKTTLTPTEGEVLINTTADAALLNLIRAINHSGTPGTDYSCAAAHPTVTAATSVTAHAFAITAKTKGTGGNSIATTVAGTGHVTWTSTVMAGGTNDGTIVTIGTTVYTFRSTLSTGPTVPFEVLIGASASATLDNLKSAVNASAGAGTTYSAGTTAHPNVVASTKNSTTILFVAKVPGTAANSIVTTTNETHLSWPEVTLGGASATQIGITPETFTITAGAYAQTLLTTNGTNPADGDYVQFGIQRYVFRTVLSLIPVPFEVLIGVSASATLDNLKSAINASAGSGTTYSTGTTKNVDVQATTKTSTTLVILELNAGVAYNTLPTLVSGATYSFPSTTIGGGGTGSYPAEAVVDSETYSFVTELSETSGAPAIKNEILWATSDAVAFDNMKLAINGGATAGTNYSTGTVANVLVTATTNTDTAQTIQAAVAGVSGNGIQVVSTIAHATWGAATLTGGLDANAIILNTFTPVAGTFYPFGQIGFANGLYATIGATCDITIFYK